MNQGVKKEGEEIKNEAADGSHEAGAEGHADASQDAELFKKLISDTLGAEHAEDQEAHSMAKEMYESAVAEGMEKEEAMKCAGSALKMSHIMGKKAAKKEAEAKEAAAKEAATKKEGQDAPAPAAEAKVVESLRSQLTSLTAENAKLKEAARKGEIEKHLDKVLKESGLATRVTKTFRALTTDCKTTKEIDERFKTFKEAFDAEPGRGSDADAGFAFEKTDINQIATGGTSDGFGDCVH